MIQNAVVKQMIDFQKTSFQASFDTIARLQEQGEKNMEMFLNQAAWIPKEGKKAVSDWVDILKKGRDQFRQAIESNFSKMESNFGAADEKKK